MINAKDMLNHFKKCHSLQFCLISFFVLLITMGCNSLESGQNTAVARVGDVYLYRSDIVSHFGSFNNYDDSLLRVQKFINTWAKEQLLYQQAQINIPDEKRRDLLRLIRQYEAELFGQVYKESIINSGMDTLISSADLSQIYNSNKSIFVLKEPIYRFRSLQMPLTNVNQEEIKKRFSRFDSIDRIFLDSLSFQFTRYFSGDSLWVNQKFLSERVTFLNEKNVMRYFKSKKLVEVKDSLNVYLFVGLEVRRPTQLAPMLYVEPSLRSILLNQRKIEFSRKFDNDLLQDAIRSKQFEILVP